MRVLKTKWFSRFARKESLSDHDLAEAVREIERGLHDSDLGGHLIKKRVARAGKGKRGGYRTIIVYNKGKRAVFVYGFAKKRQGDLEPYGSAGVPEIGTNLSAPYGGADHQSPAGQGIAGDSIR